MMVYRNSRSGGDVGRYNVNGRYYTGVLDVMIHPSKLSGMMMVSKRIFGHAITQDRWIDG